MGSQERKMAIKFDRKAGPRERQLRAMRELQNEVKEARKMLAEPIKPGPMEYVPVAIIALQAKVDAQAIEITRLKRLLAERDRDRDTVTFVTPVTPDVTPDVTPVTLGPASRERIRARARKRKQRARERSE
jgi:hypothetical protein